jgi:hypothetical protein
MNQATPTWFFPLPRMSARALDSYIHNPHLAPIPPRPTVQKAPWQPSLLVTEELVGAFMNWFCPEAKMWVGMVER